MGRRNLRSIVVCLTAMAGLCTLAPVGASAAKIEWSSTITLETPAGPVTCGLAPAAEPNWADVVVSSTPRRLSAEILGASALRCTTSSFGVVELSGAGFPWHFTLGTKRREARLSGTKKVVLEVTLVSLLGAKCVYETAKLTGSLSTGSPPVLSLSAPRVKLNKLRSNALCPAVGGFSGSFPLG
jgi:hypothetical protein